MICRERRELALFQLDRITDLDLAVSKEGSFGTRDLREIGPDTPVEDVIAQGIQRCRNGPKGERLVAHPPDGIDHERNARDVIEVRVGEKDVIDKRQFGERKVGDPRPGVDKNVVVEEHRRGAQVPAPYPAAATQDSQLHGTASAAISRSCESWVAA